MEAVLSGRVHGVVHWAGDRGGGVAAVGRQLRDRDVVLRRVHEHRAGVGVVGPSQVAGVPRDARQGGGGQLHRGGVHRRQLVDTGDRSQVHRRFDCLNIYRDT